MVNGQSITLDDLYKEILTNRQEIKNSIEASETRLLLKIEELRKKVTVLENENDLLRSKIESLEKNNKKNNIVIYGLEFQEKKISPEIIVRELKRLLDIDLNIVDIGDVFTLGNSERKPVKVEFVSYQCKIGVLRLCSNLKGTKVAIAHVLTYKQRKENKILRKHLFLARQDGKVNSYIKNNKLHVNNEIFDPDQLERAEDREEINVRPNSAPATPTRHKQGDTEKLKSALAPTLKKSVFNISETKTPDQGISSGIGNGKQPISKKRNPVAAQQVRELRSTSTTKDEI